MILTIKIEIDKSKENYQAAIEALSKFDIASASWEDESKEPEVTIDYKAKTSTQDGDPAAALSAALARVNRRRQSGI